MADRVYLLCNHGAFRVVLVVHGHVYLAIFNHIVIQCVQIIAPLFDALHESCTVLFNLSDTLFSIGARFFEDLDTANPLRELWTVAVLGELAPGLLGALIHELALDSETVDSGGQIGSGILGHVIEGETFQVLP